MKNLKMGFVVIITLLLITPIAWGMEYEKEEEKSSLIRRVSEVEKEKKLEDETLLEESSPSSDLIISNQVSPSLKPEYDNETLSTSSYGDEFSPLIHSVHNQKKVLQWLEEQVFGNVEQFSQCKNRSIFGVALFSGAGRGVVYFKLGYNLGERLLSAIDEPGRTILSSIYGTGVFAPMVVLGSKLSNSNFKKMLGSKPDNEKAIEINKTYLRKFGEYSWKGIAGVSGVFTAPTLTYLTYDELHNVIGWAWLAPGIPTFYVRTLIDYYSLTTLGDMLYNGIKTPIERCFANYNPGSRQARMTIIRDKLNEARSFIASLNYSQAEMLRDELDNKSGSLSKIALLSNPYDCIEKSEVIVQRDGLIKRGLGLLGGAVGVYGIWVYYPAAKAAFIPILSLLGVEPTDELLTGLGAFSLGASCALTAISTQSSTIKFCNAISGVCSSVYDRLTSWCYPRAQQQPTRNNSKDTILKWKRAGAATLSAVLAACYAGTQAEVALEFLDVNYTIPKIELITAVIAQFSTSFWAVDETLLDYLKAGDPRTPLLGKLDKIIAKIPDMSNESLINLQNLLVSQNRNQRMSTFKSKSINEN